MICDDLDCRRHNRQIWLFQSEVLHLYLNETDEGNGIVPFFISRTMAIEGKIQEIKKLVEGLLASEPAFFLVSVDIRPINNISVFVDGDAGITIDKCVKLNRALYKQIVETGLYEDGSFGLVVSSPGIEEPLSMNRQYTKNVGRLVEVELKEGKVIEGKLIAADADGIVVEEEKGKGKKKEVISHVLLFDAIKSTTVKVVF
ncbi:MAG: ribosome maturation factor [bacterium]